MCAMPITFNSCSKTRTRPSRGAGRRHRRPYDHSSYDTDFYAWAQQQAEALRAKDWAALDIEHLAEQVEDLRKTERRAVRSQLRLILSHLLKWRYQPVKRTDSWRSTIANGRVLVQEDLEDLPSLAPSWRAWRPGRTHALGATRPGPRACARRHSPRPTRGRSRRCWMWTSGQRPDPCYRTEADVRYSGGRGWTGRRCIGSNSAST